MLMLHKWQNAHVQLHILNIQTVMLTVSFFTNTTHILSNYCLTVYCIHTTYIQHVYKKRKDDDMKYMCNKYAYHKYIHITIRYKTTGNMSCHWSWQWCWTKAKVMAEEVDGRISSQLQYSWHLSATLTLPFLHLTLLCLYQCCVLVLQLIVCMHCVLCFVCHVVLSILLMLLLIHSA